MRVLVSPSGSFSARTGGRVSSAIQFADRLVVEVEGEVGFAGPVVEVLDGDRVSAGGFVEGGGEGAASGLVADCGFAVGGGLPGFDVDGGVAFGGHGFGFDAVGVVADAAVFVGDAGYPSGTIW